MMKETIAMKIKTKYFKMKINVIINKKITYNNRNIGLNNKKFDFI